MLRLVALLLLLAAPALAADFPIKPDLRLTPGAIRTTDAKAICAKGFSTSTVRHTTQATKEAVYRAYGITKAQRAKQDEEPGKTRDGKLLTGHFEIDHLISLELGGADEKANLWPQSYDTQPLNAHVKDALENKLHALVCTGDADLAEVQKAIAADWTAAYERYVGPLPR